MGAFSLGLSAKLVLRFGFRPPLATGLLLAATGLVLFARAPVDGSYVVDVLPSMILLGLAVLASLADSRKDSLLSSGDEPLVALNGGYHAAFLAGALFAVTAAGVG